MSEPARSGLLDVFVADARDRMRRLDSSLLELADDTAPARRQRLLSVVWEEAHALRGAASVCGRPEAAAAAELLEEVASGLSRDDLELGSSDRLELAAGLERLRADLDALEAPSLARPLPVVPPRPAEGGERTAATVLCIDDDATSRALVGALLSATPGVRLIEAADARTGLELARTELPNLILLDGRLPDIQGREVFDRLRSAPETWSIPVLMVSGDEPPSADRPQPSRYLQKPVDPKVFLDVINELLARPAVRRGHDSSTREVARAIHPLR